MFVTMLLSAVQSEVAALHAELDAARQRLIQAEAAAADNQVANSAASAAAADSEARDHAAALEAELRRARCGLNMLNWSRRVNSWRELLRTVAEQQAELQAVCAHTGLRSTRLARWLRPPPSSLPAGLHP